VNKSCLPNPWVHTHPHLQERKAALKAGLCKAFAASGACRYGDTCRFSHDTNTFLATKLPDLPGTCPFACLPACPYGARALHSSCHR
jgi:tRNA-dihydrouridine synthase 3